jgi:hypothetical protein
MTGHEKILKAGFRIYRLNLNNKTITQCAGFGRWNRFKICTSKAETQRIWDKLMEDPQNIGD